MRAVSTFNLERGTSTFWCRALIALRTRVRKSATGSVKLMLAISSNRRPFAFLSRTRSRGPFPRRLRACRGKERTSRDALTSAFGLACAETRAADRPVPAVLPGRLRNPGNFSLKRQPAETQAANAELPQKRPRPPADVAAVVLPAGELRFLVRLGDTGCLSHRFLYSEPALSLSKLVVTAPHGTACPCG